MKRKKTVFVWFIALLGIALLAGCANPPVVTVVYPKQFTYEASGSQIVREDGRVIYDAADYYAGYNDCGIGIIVNDVDSLFFTEYGRKDGNGEDVDHAIVHIDYNGIDRQVLVTKNDPNGYSDLIAYGDRLFYVNDGFDSASIGDVSKDGKEHNVVDWTAYAAQFNAPPYFGMVSFSQDDDYLYAKLSMFEEDFEGALHFARIDNKMNIEEVPPDADQYMLNGSKIYMLSKETGERSLFYDAAPNYEDYEVFVGWLTNMDDVLCFVEGCSSINWNADNLVVVDKTDGTRQILRMAPVNHRIGPFTRRDDRIFFVEEGEGTFQIRYIGLYDLEAGEVSLSDEYISDTVERIDTMDDKILVKMAHRVNETTLEFYTLSIDKDLSVQLID